MKTEERMQRMQDEIDYLRKRIEVLEGRCLVECCLEECYLEENC